MSVFGPVVAALVACTTWFIFRGITRLYFHPLSAFPGPPIAAVTGLYKAYIDVVAQSSFVHNLERLHAIYGDVVRVGPNELHFANPEVCQEIYNATNRWDKEESLYHSFGEDRSSFGSLTYAEAKPRKDILTRLFSKKAIRDAEHLVQEKVLGLCDSFLRTGERSVDLFYAFRCMSIDVITYICFGHSVNALESPGHEAPIILAMDASLPVFVRFKYSSLYKNMIIKCPPNISKVVSPATKGLVNLQVAIKEQVVDLKNNPEHLKTLPHNTTIWNELLKPEVHPDGRVPDIGSLFEESQAFLFGGADTTGTTLMHGTFCVLEDPEVYHRLKAELQQAWPDLEDAPSQSTLETLPYLSAVIRESLRMSPGVASPLPRVVPASGTKLGGNFIPGGTVVEMSSHFVHRSADTFENPNEFKPDRWMGPGGKDLEKWLVSFS
ncbi:hypothetical protein OHC33_000227 [Knufia fluminis]|uniref:Cytochrome P450 n=1 Tax=Knufia fluminis TaxID=191047 RepID=A0AAN8ICC6_9EURO|nr:hypothetical protein OHC33_000227 [Knufia fluminis]